MDVDRCVWVCGEGDGELEGVDGGGDVVVWRASGHGWCCTCLVALRGAGSMVGGPLLGARVRTD